MIRTARTIRHSIVVLAIGGGIAVGAAAASPALAATHVDHALVQGLHSSARIIPDPCGGVGCELNLDGRRSISVVATHGTASVGSQARHPLAGPSAFQRHQLRLHLPRLIPDPCPASCDDLA